MESAWSGPRSTDRQTGWLNDLKVTCAWLSPGLSGEDWERAFVWPKLRWDQMSGLHTSRMFPPCQSAPCLSTCGPCCVCLLAGRQAGWQAGGRVEGSVVHRWNKSCGTAGLRHIHRPGQDRTGLDWVGSAWLDDGVAYRLHST